MGHIIVTLVRRRQTKKTHTQKCFILTCCCLGAYQQLMMLGSCITNKSFMSNKELMMYLLSSGYLSKWLYVSEHNNELILVIFYWIILQFEAQLLTPKCMAMYCIVL